VIPSDFAQQFQPDGVVQLSLQALESMDIPSDAKEMMAEIGLPRNASPYFLTELTGIDPVPTLAEIVTKNLAFVSSTAIDMSRYYAIGYIEAAVICLEEGSGSVIWFGPGDELDSTFVNSSIRQLLIFLYSMFTRRPGPEEDVDLSSVMEVLKHDLHVADEKAFADYNYYWPVVFEQISDGLL
jgi:SUKH-4 immunity protein